MLYKRGQSQVWHYTIYVNGKRIRKSTGADNKKLAQDIYVCIPLHSAPDSGAFGTPHRSVATLVVFTYTIAPSYHVKLSVVCA